MRTRLGSNQYKKRYEVRARAIVLATPIALSVWISLEAVRFFIISFRTLKNPGVYLLIFTLFFTTISLAAAPQADLTHPYVQETIHIPTHEEIVLNAKHGDILYRVWNNETSKGVNINLRDKTDLAAYCKRKDLTNEFGYNPYNHQCFKTFQDSVETVSKWWDQCLATRTLRQCLIRYSGSSESYESKFVNQ